MIVRNAKFPVPSTVTVMTPSSPPVLLPVENAVSLLGKPRSVHEVTLPLTNVSPEIKVVVVVDVGAAPTPE